MVSNSVKVSSANSNMSIKAVFKCCVFFQVHSLILTVQHLNSSIYLVLCYVALCCVLGYLLISSAFEQVHLTVQTFLSMVGLCACWTGRCCNVFFIHSRQICHCYVFRCPAIGTNLPFYFYVPSNTNHSPTNQLPGIQLIILFLIQFLLFYIYYEDSFTLIVLSEVYNNYLVKDTRV